MNIAQVVAVPAIKAQVGKRSATGLACSNCGACAQRVNSSCLPAGLPARLPACRPACLPACLPYMIILERVIFTYQEASWQDWDVEYQQQHAQRATLGGPINGNPQDELKSIQQQSNQINNRVFRSATEYPDQQQSTPDEQPGFQTPEWYVLPT